MQVLVLHFHCPEELQKNCFKATRTKKKKHNKIDMITSSKLNSIKTKISEALINIEISHEDFMTILNEERSY